MALTRNYLIGSILSFAGGFFFLWASFYAFIAPTNYYYFALFDRGLTWNDVNFNPELFTIRFIITLIWGIFSTTGGLLSILGKSFGNIFCYISGIGGLIGFSVALGYIDLPFTDIPISFSESLFPIDIVLSISAGVALTRSRNFIP